MENTILKAMARDEGSSKEVRAAGFIPGVLYGDNATATSVKFGAVALNKIIAKHGANAKIWVEFGTEKKFGYIMEIQRRPVEPGIIHVTIKLLNADQEIKMQLPITYHGREELEPRSLQVQIYKSEIEVEGKATLMPDTVIFDVSNKEAEDTITATDFNLPQEIKVLDGEHEIYAVIKAIHEQPVEAAAEVKEPEAAKPTE